MFQTYQQVIEHLAGKKQKKNLAISAAHDDAVIKSALEAEKIELAHCIFVGQGREIERLIRKNGENPNNYQIVSAAENNETQAAINLVHAGQAQILMKGYLDTRLFLGPIVKKENNLRTGRTMSHLAFFQIPNYPKLLMNTDGGMVMYPSLTEKVQIIRNAVDAMNHMGYSDPSFAVICAVEKVDPKMPETVEAEKLMQMNIRGEITGCRVIGPLSYDVAMSAEIAEHKKVDCEFCGSFDGLILPNIQAGNILGKSLIVTAGAIMSGFIVGAKVPVIMNSRGATPEEKLYSMAMAVLAAG